ncbi:protein translocase subunit secF [Tepidamorphus gemmatus]|uniref:Protein-export membrane protein SecF n=1 Tax=Tepidamorphus gemmatus TaxID=747076 RepID=A0A4R3MFU1_9HYPH|nr:protein translocase subunit SecF [Tepidamorphus gemmatus]TCT12396.1 protein translocase subunit secF [Tepidamorphus gemmatus]
MRLLRLVPDDTHIRFMWLRRFTMPLSAAMSVLSIVLFLVVGLNFGIDFRGGSLIEVQTRNGPADIAQMRATLSGLGLGDLQIQEFGGPNDVLIRVVEQPGGELAQQAVITKVREALGDSVEYRRVEIVGPTVSAELARTGTIAVIVAIIAILIYIWFRFEWQYAVGAVVATIHDVVLTIGLFAVLQLDFNLSSIAAILTIVGYSLNDTVVVYDRIRENARRFKRMAVPELIDLSINQTLSRTVMTSLTTLLALVALYVFGGEVIRSFVFAMIWGVLVGTYSSIYVAAPILHYLGLRPGGDAAAAAAQGSS